MKTLLPLILILFFHTLQAQITTPIIKANFGVDADLRANYFDGFQQNGNDDWFNNGTPGTGSFVIDTSGATSMVSRFLTDPVFRRQPFFRTMRVPQYSIVNNRLWIDAVYIRDYNGQSGGDETAFVSSNKNGDSPNDWKGGATSVLDKNDIAEMMVHVRRDSASRTSPLWFFGGLSLQGTTGNRYFDFELYQTDIFYTRSTGKFSNYGPDAGHTSWEFDAAGNITKPGDVIFSAEYSSSSLTAIEARIWVNKAALSTTPQSFNWGGSFDGASTGSQYGYASIKPKVAGTYYTGLQSGNGTWAGPFGFIDGGNNYLTTYANRQFMEFSVNLTFLGLDPITLLGGGACGLPFRRILVKTRTSTSFSSELKDFIGPFDFFKAPPVEAVANVPLFCGVMGVSDIKVTNPLPASVYNWSTTNGHIVGDSVGASITVDKPGTYIVSQQLLDGCGAYARDTVTIVFDATCVPMEVNALSLKGSIREGKARLAWKTGPLAPSDHVILQRSTDGKTFQPVFDYSYLPADGSPSQAYTDDVSGLKAPQLFYRLARRTIYGDVTFSAVTRLANLEGEGLRLYPNPAAGYFQLVIPSTRSVLARVSLATGSGVVLQTTAVRLTAGNTLYTSPSLAALPAGYYLVGVETDGKTTWQPLVIQAAPRPVQ